MGVAGDMTIAALIDLLEKLGHSIDLSKLHKFMSRYGRFRVKQVATGRKVYTTYNGALLSYATARTIVRQGIDELALDADWAKFALQALELLIAAETKAHAKDQIKKSNVPAVSSKVEVQQVDIPSDAFRIIGYAHTSVSNPPLQVNSAESSGEFYIEIDPKYQEGLQDLSIYEQIWVISYLHKSSGFKLHVYPPWDDTATPRGLFSTRSPHRPSPIGLTRVSIQKIKEGKIYINQLDLLHGTPILDIKPVLGIVDRVQSNNGYVTSKEHLELHRKGIAHIHDETFGHLHEAADIVLDILAPAYLLNHIAKLTDVQFAYIPPVQVGGGTVLFSHGTLSVPAPATQHILNVSRLHWEYGPVATELLTPTGIALLTALHPLPIGTTQLAQYSITATGFGYGHKELTPTNVLAIHYAER